MKYNACLLLHYHPSTMEACANILCLTVVMGQMDSALMDLYELGL